MAAGSKTAVIVQARMGSIRFPGKMMAPLCGVPIIEWVLGRLSRCRQADALVLAIPDTPSNAPLQEIANRLNVAVWRGDEADVLGRFVGAANAIEADVLVRVCADNPVVDPEVIDSAIQAYYQLGVDYVFNHVPRLDCLYPDGLGGEVLSAALLREIDAKATAPAQREHVTSYLWENADRYRLMPAPCAEPWRANGDAIRLDVDEPADLEELQSLLEGVSTDIPAAEILRIWRAKMHGRAAN